MLTLLAMRHAKSDWSASYEHDHDRPLSTRGIQSARAVGKYLSQPTMTPQMILASTAVRAATTAELARESGGWKCDIRRESEFYGTGADRVLAVASGTDASIRRLMIVGHEPTWSTIVHRISGEEVAMKTGCVAIIDIDESAWFGLATASGQLRELVSPRILLGTE